jgi:hypothetical protein
MRTAHGSRRTLRSVLTGPRLTLRSADAGAEAKPEDGGMSTKMPAARLADRKLDAGDTGLLAAANANKLAVEGERDRVRLRVAQCDRGE